MTKKSTVTFALVDMKEGRKALAKLVRNHDQKIPITLTGHIVGQWSDDDTVSIEFEISVYKCVLGKPVPHDCPCIRCKPARYTKKATHASHTDKSGRIWAHSTTVKVGDVLECDGGFTCMSAGDRKTVKASGPRTFARMYVECSDGSHMLDGQLGRHGELVGFYPVAKG